VAHEALLHAAPTMIASVQMWLRPPFGRKAPLPPYVPKYPSRLYRQAVPPSCPPPPAALATRRMPPLQLPGGRPVRTGQSPLRFRSALCYIPHRFRRALAGPGQYGAGPCPSSEIRTRGNSWGNKDPSPAPVAAQYSAPGLMRRVPDLLERPECPKPLGLPGCPGPP